MYEELAAQLAASIKDQPVISEEANAENIRLLGSVLEIDLNPLFSE